MNRLIPVLAVIAPLALTACGQGGTVEARNASVAEVAEKARGAAKMEAGEWEMRTEILNLGLPEGMDPKLAEAMRSAMAQSAVNTTTDCVTPEEAEQPAARMFAGDSAANCKYEHFTMGGGKIDAALVCGAAGPGGAERHSRMTMKGSFTGSSIDMETEVAGSAGGGMGSNMKMRLTGKRTGPCKTAPEKAG